MAQTKDKEPLLPPAEEPQSPVDDPSRRSIERAGKSVPDEAVPSLLPFIWNTGLLRVYILAILHNAAFQTSVPTLLLYVKDQGWSPSNGWYTAAYVTGVVVPFLANYAATRGLSILGLTKSLLIGQTLSMVGYAIAAFVPNSYVFVASYGLGSVVFSMRCVRLAALSEGTPHGQFRTKAVALHAVTNPIGSLIGVGITKLIAATCHGCKVSLHDGVELDGNTLAFMSSAGVNLLATVFVLVLVCQARTKEEKTLGGEEEDDSDVSESDDQDGRRRAASIMTVDSAILPPSPSGLLRHSRRSQQLVTQGNVNDPEACEEEDKESVPLHITLDDGSTYVITPRSFVFRQGAFFIVLTFLTNFSTSFFTVAFQPLLVDHLGFSKDAVTNIYIITTAASVIPALLIIPLTRVMSDKSLMLLGLWMKLAGMVCYATPPVGEYQVIIGSIFIQKASVFFFSCSVALLSKTLQQRCGGPMAWLFSGITAANAIASVIGGSTVSSLVGGYPFLAFCIPIIAAMAMLHAPTRAAFGVELDPASPVVKRVIAT